MGVNTEYCSDLNGNQEFKCECKDGYDGKRCEVSVCTMNPTAHPCCGNPCQNGATREGQNGSEVSFHSNF